MSQYSKMKHSRQQWKAKAIERGQAQRYQRKQSARHKATAEQKSKALGAAEARIGELEAQLHELTTLPKVDVVHLALQLFLEARIGFRAVSRVLTLLAWVLGIKKAPCPQTVINWVMRLTPTVCLGVTCVVVYAYGHDNGRIWPTRCAVIDAALDGI